MSIEYVFAGLAVTGVDAAIDWYERLLGKPPDMRPNDREATWRLTETASVYIVADEDRAGQSAVTMFVDDLDAELDGIARRGIPVGEGTDNAGPAPEGQDQRSRRQRDPARRAPRRGWMIEEVDCAR